MNRFFWNMYSIMYDSLLALIPYRTLMQKVGESITGEKIFNAGCGTGNLESFLYKTDTGHVVIIAGDNSPYMLRRARKKHGNAASFILLDLDSTLPFADHSIDCVTSVNSFYALKDPPFSLREIHRVLKVGGTIIIATPKLDPSMSDIIKEHFEAIRSLSRGEQLKEVLRTALNTPSFLAIAVINALIVKKLAQHKKFHFFEKSKLEEMLAECGFVIEESGLIYGGTDLFVKARRQALSDERELFLDKLSVGIAETRDDLDKIYRLRYEVYCNELRSLEGKDYPDNKERDAYDDDAVHIIIKDGESAIGTLRLIKDSDKGFLMEEQFTLPEDVDKDKTVEFSRGIIKREYRSMNLHSLLFDTAYSWMRENGYSTCIAAAVSGQAVAIFEKYDWVQIGEPQEYHNTISIPMMKKISLNKKM